MGFRVLGHRKGLVFKLGYSHKILFLKKMDIVFFYLARLSFIIKSRCILTLKNILSTILHLKKEILIKKREFFIKGWLSKLN